MKLAHDLMARDDWAILDTETTGLGAKDEIVQIGLLSPTGDVLLDTLIKPTIPIPFAATRIHGISDADVAAAPGFTDIYLRLVELAANKEIIVYNADYDFRMTCQTIAAAYSLDWNIYTDDTNISQFALLIGDKWTCAMTAYAVYWKQWNDFRQSYTWQSLINACHQQGVPVTNEHSAIGDCKLTLELIRKLGGNHDRLYPRTDRPY